MSELEKRTHVYVQRPKDYEIAPCDCGNVDPDWSEYKHHLWCAKCRKDFIPAHNGIFDGPIPVNVCRLMRISFDRINLETGAIERFVHLRPDEPQPTGEEKGRLLGAQDAIREEALSGKESVDAD